MAQRAADGEQAHGDHARSASLKLDLEKAMAVLTEGERAAIGAVLP